MKSKVDIDASGIEIAAMRKAKSGEMLLEIKGGKGATEALRETIKERIPGSNVRIKKDEKVVQIRDLDALATEDEIIEALKNTLGTENDSIKIKELRDAYGENQVATVALPEEAAQKLLSMGKVKIGWLRCRVREQIDILRCYRCWETGHTATKCEGPDRTKLCLRCGREGHMAKNCKEARYCPICSQQGHRADTGGCPHYKRALAEARRQIAQKHN